MPMGKGYGKSGKGSYKGHGGNRSGGKAKRMNGDGGTSYGGTNYHAGKKKMMKKRK